MEYWSAQKTVLRNKCTVVTCYDVTFLQNADYRYLSCGDSDYRSELVKSIKLIPLRQIISSRSYTHRSHQHHGIGYYRYYHTSDIMILHSVFPRSNKVPALSSFFFFFGLLIIHDCIALAPRPSGRRELLHQTACATVLSWTVGCSATHATPTNSVTSMLDSLRSVPTFCVVDAEGASYMLYQSGTDESAFAKGYAFLTFPGALAVLSDAQRTAEKGAMPSYGRMQQLRSSRQILPYDWPCNPRLEPVRRATP